MNITSNRNASKHRPFPATFLSTLLLASIVLAAPIEPGLSFAQEAAPVSKADLKKLEKELIKAGRKLYYAKDYDGAINKWAEVLSLNPESKKAKRYINEARKRLEKQLAREMRYVKVASPSGDAAPVLGVNDCVNIAITNSIPLRIAEKSVKLADMRLFEARRNMLPSVGIRWEEVDGRVNARRYIGKKQSVEGQQPVFHGGELYFTMKQAEVHLEILKTDYRRVKNELVFQVKKAYYTLAKSKENYRIQEELKKEADKISDMVNKQFEFGIISKLEHLNVSSQTSQIGFQLVSAEGDMALAELILKQAMNVDSNDSVRIEPKLEYKKLEVNFETILNAAFLNRPEMKINSLLLMYYRYQKDIMKAKGWPKIDLMGSWGLAKEEFASEDFDLRPVVGDINRRLEQQWYAGVKASMPFWGSTAEYSQTREQWVPVVSTVHGTEAKTDSIKVNFLDNLKYYSDKQLADIELDRAAEEFNKTKHDVTLEVREGCYNYEKSVLQLETTSNKVKYQETDLAFVKAKRGMDEAQDSNVVESMIRLAQEKFGYAQAMTDYYIAVASINKAIGKEDFFNIEE